MSDVVGKNASQASEHTQETTEIQLANINQGFAEHQHKSEKIALPVSQGAESQYNIRYHHERVHDLLATFFRPGSNSSISRSNF